MFHSECIQRQNFFYQQTAMFTYFGGSLYNTFLVWEWTGKDDSYKAFTIPSSTLNISLINASVARYASSVEESQILNNLGNNELR